MKSSRGWQPFVYQKGERWYGQVVKTFGPFKLTRAVCYYPYTQHVSTYSTAVGPTGHFDRRTAEIGAVKAARMLNGGRSKRNLIPARENV